MHKQKITKIKTTEKSNTGINKKKPVPEVLINFLGLEDDVLMSRPDIVSAFNTKLKDLGIKKGQITTLNKDVVKELGLDKTYIDKEIGFGEIQTLIKMFYTNDE